MLAKCKKYLEMWNYLYAIMMTQQVGLAWH